MQSKKVHAPEIHEDTDLIRYFQAGTNPEAAFEALFERYGAVTYGFFRRRVGDPEVAAELNQNLYLAVVKSLPSFRGESSFKTWLFRIAHNELHHLRRRWHTHLDEQGSAIPDEMWDQLADDKLRPAEDDVAEAQMNRALKTCMAKLPEVERAIVIGNYYQGVTLRELSERLQMDNRSGARAPLIAALRKLRRCLGEAGFSGLGQGGT